MIKALNETKKKSTYEFIDAPLSILYSCRIRLDDQQRETLKTALNAFRLNNTPAQQQTTVPGSSISVQTNVRIGQTVYKEHGLSDLIVNNLISTRESVPLNILIKLQQMLGVEVIERKELESKFQRYLDYVLQ